MRSLCLCLLAPLLACGGDDEGSPHDAAPDRDGFTIVDAEPRIDADPLAWVDFATSGCALVATPAGDAGATTLECQGAAPLAVTFAPIAAATVDAYLWTFGDGGSTDQATPTHVFVLPGRYDAGLSVSGPGGTATAARAGFVVVGAAAPGAACTASAQCDDGGSCLCGGDAGCEGGWAAGACVTPCTDCDGACARLGGAASDAPWAGEHCLPSCAGDASCPVGRTCAVTPGASGVGWVEVCVPSAALAPIGASCASAAGLDDDACASGLCAPLGLRGACSATCAGVACPGGSTCATFAGAVGARCVATCTGAPDECAGDPWLGCVAPGGAGDLGFTVPGGAGTYCAPRTCAAPADCPAGVCSGGYCRPSP